MTTDEKSIHVSLSPWVIKEILGDIKNRSAKVEELIIKGWMSQRMQNAKQAEKNVVLKVTPHNPAIRRFVTLMASGEATRPLLACGQVFTGLGVSV
jgi:hypothetical protein